MPLSQRSSLFATRVAQEFNAVRSELAPALPVSPRTVAHASSITIDPTVPGDQVNITATGNITSLGAATTGAADRQQLDIAVLASGGSRQVTFAAAVHTSTGLIRGPYVVGSGEVLFALLRYSELLDEWALVAATVTAS